MPSASQFIQIKRLQTGINGRIANTKQKRAADTYEGYAGSNISTLPPNVLLSNKFIVEEESGGGGGGGNLNTYTLALIDDTITHKLQNDPGDTISITDSNFYLAFSGVTSVLPKKIISLTITLTSDFMFQDSNIILPPEVLIDPIVISNKNPDVSIPINFNPYADNISFNIEFVDIDSSLTITQVVVDYES